MTQFFLLLKACSHSVCVHCMRDVFSKKRIEKSYDAIFLGMISKIDATRHTSELYNKDSVTYRWAEKRKKRKKTKTAKQTTNWICFSLTEAMEKSKNR